MSTRKEKESTNLKRCYLCGEFNASTRDHVISRGLFDLPLPLNLITAPACSWCNNSLSKDEEFFRFFILTGQDEHPVAKTLWKEKVLSSFRQSPRFKQMLKSKVRLNPVKTESGLYLGEAPFFYADRLRIDAVLRKIVRGLFYHHKKTYLESTIRTFTHDMYNYENWAKIEDLPGGELGNRVFKYRYVISEINPHNSVWNLVFYDKHLFIVGTDAQNHLALV